MTDPRAAKIIDELIVLLSLGEARTPDYNAVEEGIAYLMETRRDHPQHPVTLRLFQEMAKRGMVT